MTTHPSLPRLAMLLLLSGCGEEAPTPPPVPAPPAPAPTEPAALPEPEVPAPARYSLHEWGLIGVETGGALGSLGGSVARAPATDVSREAARSPSVVRENREALRVLEHLDEHSIQRILGDPLSQEGLSHPRPGATGKPVIYLHVPSDAPPVDVTISLGVGASHLLEHWPAGTATADALTWNVRATTGACTTPAAAPMQEDAACRDVRDGFCEAAEIPRYHGQDDTCVSVGGVEAPLLFYRGEGADVTSLPLALRVWLAGDTAGGREVTRRGTPPDGPVLFVERDGDRSRIHALQAPDYAIPGPEEAGISPAEARALLLTEALRRGLVAEEADAFVDAWAPAYFGEATREGPVAVGQAPASLAEADRALLYFAPEAVIDAVLPLTLSPPPSARHRVFLVRYVDTTAPGEARVSTEGDAEAYDPRRDPARLRLGSPSIRGGLPAATVRSVVQRHQAQLFHCYELLLMRSPSTSGAVSIQFVITPPGTVGVATVLANSTGDEAVATCMASAVRRWTFPVAEGTTAVSYPFQLTRDE